MTFGEDVLATVARITRACEVIAIPWAVGGSFASGLYGEPRSTNDVDMIACLRLGDVRRASLRKRARRRRIRGCRRHSRGDYRLSIIQRPR